MAEVCFVELQNALLEMGKVEWYRCAGIPAQRPAPGGPLSGISIPRGTVVPGVGQGGVGELVGVLEGRATRGSNSETLGKEGEVVLSPPPPNLPSPVPRPQSISIVKCGR